MGINSVGDYLSSVVLLEERFYHVIITFEKY